MRKVKYIALLLFFALGLLGGAYAAWTEQLVIGGTVDTAELEMNFTWHTGNSNNNDLIDVDIEQIDNKTLKVTVNNLYPGSWALLEAKIANNSSIPVRFDRALLTFDDPENPAVSFLKSRVGASYSPDGTGGGLLIADLPFDSFLLAELDEKLNASSQLKGVVLEPGEPGGWLSLSSVGIVLDEGADNDTQGQTVTFTLELVFRQWNI